MGADQAQQGVPGNKLVEPLRQAFLMSLARLAAKIAFRVCEGELSHGMPRLILLIGYPYRTHGFIAIEL